MVYPTNLLRELKPLLNGSALGVLDPEGELQPVLKGDGIEFINLENMALEDFHGRLAIIGPFDSPAQMQPGLAQRIQKIAAAGTAVVWLQPPDPKAEITPSFYLAPGGKANIVVAKSDLVAHFSENPQSQLALVHFCKLALNPEPFLIPNLALQP